MVTKKLLNLNKNKLETIKINEAVKSNLKTQSNLFGSKDKETEERLLKELRAENLSKNDILAIIIATFEIIMPFILVLIAAVFLVIFLFSR